MSTPKPIRLLAAHASPQLAASLRRAVAATSDITLVGECREWSRARDLAATLKPDLLTIDAALPGLGGPGAIGELIHSENQRVVMTATAGCGFPESIVACLEVGIVDFAFRRPEHSWSSAMFLDALLSRVRTAAKAPIERLRPPVLPDLQGGMAADPGDAWVLVGDIGATHTLLRVLPQMKPDLPAALCVALSLPGPVTRALSHYLDARCAFPVHEARPGDLLQRGSVFVLPGSHVATIRASYDGTPTVYLAPRRPGAPGELPLDQALMQFSQHMRTRVALLSGSGPDGVRGTEAVRASGGRVFVAPNETCLFTGLRDAVAARGLVDAQLGERRLAAPALPTPELIRERAA